MKDSERREVRGFVEGVELRAAPSGERGPGTMVGYAAVFNKVSCDLSNFREVISRGAFAKSLVKCDVRGLYNHDPNNLLGRTTAGTLRLVEDELGLRAEIDLPDTTLGRDVAEMIRRRDLQGMSFSFTTAPETDLWEWSGDQATRTVTEVDELFDVGPVAFPAYEETSVAMRQYRSLREQRMAPTKAPSEDHASERQTARLALLEAESQSRWT